MSLLKVSEIRSLLAQASNPLTTRAQKGQALEKIVGLTFGSVKGIELRGTNTRTVFESEEIDAVLMVDDCRGIPLRSMVVLVECKNWANPVGSDEVAWFETKLRRRSLNDGILIAASGITGDPLKLNSAHDIIQAALGAGVRILVVTRDDIGSLNSTDDVIELLKAKQVLLASTRSSIRRV